MAPDLVQCRLPPALARSLRRTYPHDEPAPVHAEALRTRRQAFGIRSAIEEAASRAGCRIKFLNQTDHSTTAARVGRVFGTSFHYRKQL